MKDLSVDSDVQSLAPALLDRLQAAFDRAVDCVAQLCARGGRLEGKRVDAHQWVCYELALMSADLLAAKTLVAARANISAIDRGLAAAFAAEAIASTLDRLQAVFLECELDADELHAIASSAGLARLRKEAA